MNAAQSHQWRPLRKGEPLPGALGFILANRPDFDESGFWVCELCPVFSPLTPPPVDEVCIARDRRSLAGGRRRGDF